MKISSLFTTVACLAIVLTSCDSQPSGLTQQSVVELEMKLEASRRRVEELQLQLDAKGQKTPAAATAVTGSDSGSAETERRDNIANAAKLLGAALQARVGPSKVSTLGEVAWVGITVESSGVITGAAVPFYRTPSDNWQCVWSEKQILDTLGQGKSAVAAAAPPQPTPQAPLQTATQSPSVQPFSTPVPPPAPVPSSPSRQQPAPLFKTVPQPSSGSALPSGGQRLFVVDPVDGKMYEVMPDGRRVARPEFR